MHESLDARGSRLPKPARRRQLLAAAQDVFVAQGYHAAAMDDIAERAGVSKPVLYQHFPSKLELYLAVLDAHADALLESIHAGLSATEDNRLRVHNLLSSYFDFIDGEERGAPGVFRLIFESDLSNEPAVRARTERINDSITAAVADTVAGDTGLSRTEAELLAQALTGAAQIAARWWIGSGRPVPRSDAVRSMEALLWRGISHFPRAAALPAR